MAAYWKAVAVYARHIARSIGPALNRDEALSALGQAIIAHTKRDDMLWIGETLLAELEKETGYKPPPAEAA